MGLRIDIEVKNAFVRALREGPKSSTRAGETQTMPYDVQLLLKLVITLTTLSALLHGGLWLHRRLNKSTQKPAADQTRQPKPAGHTPEDLAA